MATGAAQFGLGDESNLGLNLGVDQIAKPAFAAIGHRVVVGHEAKHRGGDAHLLHLGVRCQAGLQADHPRATGYFAATDFILNGVGIIPVHFGIVVGNFGGVLLLQLAVFQTFSQGGDGCGIEFHAATLLEF